MTSRDVDGSEAIGPSSPQGNSGTPSNLPSPPHGVRELVERLKEARRRFDESAQLHAYIDAELETLDEAADALTAQDQRLAELTKERDEANERAAKAQRVGDMIVSRKDLAELMDAKEAASARSTRAEGLLGRVKSEARLPPGRMRSKVLQISGSLWAEIAALLSSISGGEGEGFGQTNEVGDE